MNKKNDSRRKLLKSIAAGSGAVVAGKTLPDAWTKPVVDSVLLPAHASTSGGDYFGSFTWDLGYAEVTFELCFQCVGTNCSAKVLEGEYYYYEGSGSLGADMILNQLTDCDTARLVLEVETVSDVATGQLSFLGDGGEKFSTTPFSIPMAACGISAADDACEKTSKLGEAKSEYHR